MAAPSIIFGLLDNPGANRVQMNVAGEGIQIGIRINQHCLVPIDPKRGGGFAAESILDNWLKKIPERETWLFSLQNLFFPLVIGRKPQITS